MTTSLHNLEGEDGAVTRTVAGRGAVVPIAGGLEHTIRNESDEDAEAVVVFSPGEPMEHGIEITRSIQDALTDTGEEPTDPRSTSGAAYLTIARFPGDGDQLLDESRKYSDTMSEVGRDHGLILHAGARTESGFLVVNLWASKENSEAAARDPRRLGVIEQAEINPGQIRREHHQVAHFDVFDRGGTPTAPRRAPLGGIRR